MTDRLDSPDLRVRLDVRRMQKQSDGIYDGPARDVVVITRENGMRYELPEFVTDAASDVREREKMEGWG